MQDFRYSDYTLQRGSQIDLNAMKYVMVKLLVAKELGATEYFEDLYQAHALLYKAWQRAFDAELK